MPVPQLVKRNPEFRQADLERCALFGEADFRLGGPYLQQKTGGVFRDGIDRGKTFTIPGPKKVSALNQGMFREFTRIGVGEGYTDRKELVMRHKAEQAKFRISKEPWRPAPWPKKSSGKGSYFGTLAGKFTYMNPSMVQAAPEKKLGKNFLTNPGKLGTGYGYANITINKYPKHITPAIDPKKNRELVDAELVAESSRRRGAFRSRVPDNRAFRENPWRDELQKGDLQSYLRAPPPPPPKPPKPWFPVPRSRKGKLAAFEKFPAYMTDLYVTRKNYKPDPPPNAEGRRWLGAWMDASERTYYTESLVKKSIKRSFNRHNLDTFQPSYFPRVADRLLKQRKPHLRYANKEDALRKVPTLFKISHSLPATPYALRKTRRRLSNIDFGSIKNSTS